MNLMLFLSEDAHSFVNHCALIIDFVSIFRL